MNRERIKKLLKELPSDSPYCRFMHPSSNWKDTDPNPININPTVLDYACYDLAFAWRYTRAFFESNVPLPFTAMEEMWINRAWDYMMKLEYDEILTDVISIQEPHHKRKRDFIRAMLLIPDRDFAYIAAKINMDVEVVEAYEFLFFGVRDRMQEEDFIAQLVFPDGMQSEFRENYVVMEDLGQLMLKAAHTHGEESLNAVGGFGSTAHRSEHNAAEAGHRMESFMMSNGVLLSRMGLLNQKNVPGINHAKNVIVASKQAGIKEKSDDDIMGLGAAGLAYSIAQDVARIQSKDLRFRNLARAKIAQKQAESGGKFVAPPL